MQIFLRFEPISCHLKFELLKQMRFLAHGGLIFWCGLCYVVLEISILLFWLKMYPLLTLKCFVSSVVDTETCIYEQNCH